VAFTADSPVSTVTIAYFTDRKRLKTERTVLILPLVGVRSIKIPRVLLAMAIGRRSTFARIKAASVIVLVIGVWYDAHHALLYNKQGGMAMFEKGKVYYRMDGAVDWLKTIVRTVYGYVDQDAAYVVSLSATRAQEMYYRKTDIRSADNGYGR